MSLTAMDSVRAILDGYFLAPAIVLVANSVWGRAENVTAIAVFDSRQMAEAYELASRLPAGRNEDDRWRTYRPDSLLWDYNMGTYFRGLGSNPKGMFHPALPWVDLSSLPRNPPPPASIPPESAPAPSSAGASMEAPA